MQSQNDNRKKKAKVRSGISPGLDLVLTVPRSSVFYPYFLLLIVVWRLRDQQVVPDISSQVNWDKADLGQKLLFQLMLALCHRGYKFLPLLFYFSFPGKKSISRIPNDLKPFSLIHSVPYQGQISQPSPNLTQTLAQTLFQLMLILIIYFVIYISN